MMRQLSCGPLQEALSSSSMACIRPQVSLGGQRSHLQHWVRPVLFALFKTILGISRLDLSMVHPKALSGVNSLSCLHAKPH